MGVHEHDLQDLLPLPHVTRWRNLGACLGAAVLVWCGVWIVPRGIWPTSVDSEHSKAARVWGYRCEAERCGRFVARGETFCGKHREINRE